MMLVRLLHEIPRAVGQQLHRHAHISILCVSVCADWMHWTLKAEKKDSHTYAVSVSSDRVAQKGEKRREAEGDPVGTSCGL